MGSISSYKTKAGRRYRARYRDSQRKQRDKWGFRTKRDAELFLASTEVQLRTGEWSAPELGRITVGEWAEKWFASQVQLKPTTLAGYRHGLDKHVLPRWGRTRLSDVNHGDVQIWINEMATKLAPGGVRQMHLLLSGVLKFAVRDGRIPRNPCEGVNLPRVLKKRRGYLSHEQVRALAETCGEYGDLVMLLAYTGLRWGELSGLKVKRLDMLRRRIEVAEAVSEPGGVATWGTPKSHERRSVPFPSFLAEPLSIRCQGKGPEDLVFTSPEGGVLRNGNFRRRYFDKAVATATAADPSFPRVTPHDLRHTAASLAVSAGANVKAVQRMLGHASAAMTLDVYADLFDDDLDAVATALDQQVTVPVVGEMWGNGTDRVAPVAALNAKTPV